MAEFSGKSKERLGTCDERLVRLFTEVVKYFDCTVLCGMRDKDDQDWAFMTGNSDKRWPDSRHNVLPEDFVQGVGSRAVDVGPYPLDWKDEKRLCFFAGFVMAKANDLGIRLRWGGDWDGDTDLKDQKLHDLVHFEIME